MPTSKPRANDDGVLLLIKLRRQRAKDAMCHVVSGFIRFPVRLPSVVLLLDYLSNMFFCLELMLKLLSKDWGSHNVADMYKEAFGCEYKNPDLMIRLKQAITDQKYLVEPASDIAQDIPELEELFRTLNAEIKSRYKVYSVEVNIELSRGLGEFLRDYAGLFYHRAHRPGEGIDAGLIAFQTEVKQITENIE